MDTEDLIVDNHTQGEEVKHVRKVMPDVRISIFPCAFRIKSIRLRNATRLVVPTNEMNALGISQFKAHEQRYCFNAEEATINIVTWSGSAEK